MAKKSGDGQGWKKEVHWNTIVTIVIAFRSAREKILKNRGPYYYEILSSGKLREGLV